MAEVKSRKAWQDSGEDELVEGKTDHKLKGVEHCLKRLFLLQETSGK